MYFKKFLAALGNIGVLVSAGGCGFCFPALGALGTSLGLGILSQFEGILITYLLPIFAALSLLIAFIAWVRYPKNIRLAGAMLGPIIVLATLYLFWPYSWRNILFYSGLIIMSIVGLSNIIWPPVKDCRINKQC